MQTTATMTGHPLEMVLDHIDAHRDTYRDELFELLRIPSVSAQPNHAPDIRRAAEFVRANLEATGVAVQLVETAGHPLVYGEWLGAPGQPTLLIYGHYDVQPPDPLDQWLSPPFEPTLRDGNIYCRGATDDKGQMFTHLKAVDAWMKSVGKLPINVKFLIEGEEEVGGANLERYVAENTAKLACDYAVISDTSQYAPGLPALTYGLRGLAYFELRVRGPRQDLHSGIYGGAITNPANALVQMLAGLRDDQGRITIPGFYDDVRPLEDWERAEYAQLPFDENAFRDAIGVPSLAGEAGYTTTERRWARPTFDINGLFGGYQLPGPKTIIPAEAGAKFSFRLVPDQDPEAITPRLRARLAELAPPGVVWELLVHSGGKACRVDPRTPGFQAASRAIERAFGIKPVLIREGGSIPVVGLIKDHLKVDTLLMGWGQNDDNLHSPNEKFALADFERGIRASACLLAELATS
ncbi:peptidase M20 [Isosphaera pallida ATCC 43644]|uniref:Peptidase M20 n=1 Tax=Isosphaera pallida (strain ATCC 43644 / DSM 9630 / IS1B) TaxID=575540 RepID=E8QZX0_ISOPI|nr:dipeptidase [Isosphaera pallida]ADV63261.1 peptidase M20 [Isosphaera pallida ATCC 43644]